MSTELRSFLALSYDELEELNLKAKEERKHRVAAHKIQEERIKYLTDEKTHQGCDRALQRSWRPVAHARLRQEVPAEELGQPHLRRIVDPRLYRAARKRSAPGHRLGCVLLGSRRRVRLRQVLVFGEVIDKGGTPYAGDIRGVAPGSLMGSHVTACLAGSHKSKLSPGDGLAM